MHGHFLLPPASPAECLLSLPTCLLWTSRVTGITVTFHVKFSHPLLTVILLLQTWKQSLRVERDVHGQTNKHRDLGAGAPSHPWAGGMGSGADGFHSDSLASGGPPRNTDSGPSLSSCHRGHRGDPDHDCTGG